MDKLFCCRRRHWCEAPEEGSNEWNHRTVVEVLGVESCYDGRPASTFLQDVVQEFEKRSYKKICGCSSCIIFEQVFKAPKQSLNREPMMESITKVLGKLCKGIYGKKGICSSASQNGDGSSTTTWTV